MYFEGVISQYGLLIFAILSVVVLKYYSVQKAYGKKLESFVHPSTFLEEMKTKIKSLDEARDILALNLAKVATETNRLRNIAILIEFIEEKGAPIRPLKKKIEQEFSKIEGSKLNLGESQYKKYILSKVDSA